MCLFLLVRVLAFRVGSLVGVLEGEAAGSQLDEGDAERPDIGFDGIWGTLDSLGLDVSYSRDPMQLE